MELQHRARTKGTSQIASFFRLEIDSSFDFDARHTASQELLRHLGHRHPLHTFVSVDVINQAATRQ